jgi:hypothetical protein
MTKPKSKAAWFFISYGSSIIATIGLFLFLFIPIVGVIVTFYALAFTLVINNLYRIRKSDIAFCSIALGLEIIAFISNVIINLNALR